MGSTTGVTSGGLLGMGGQQQQQQQQQRSSLLGGTSNLFGGLGGNLGGSALSGLTGGTSSAGLLGSSGIMGQQNYGTLGINKFQPQKNKDGAFVNCINATDQFKNMSFDEIRTYDMNCLKSPNLPDTMRSKYQPSATGGFNLGGSSFGIGGGASTGLGLSSTGGSSLIIF